MLKTKEEIAKWLDDMDVENYVINDDLTVDVDGDVDLSTEYLTEIPVQFGTTHTFDCSENNLKSLKGCPHTVKGSFSCKDNMLYGLEHAPLIVEDGFVCSSNRLVSLQGCPKKVDSFDCSDNTLISLDFCPTEVSGNFYCEMNKLTSLKGCPPVVGHFGCSDNLLTSLEFGPKEAESYNCDRNQIADLEHAPLVVKTKLLIRLNPIRTLAPLLNKSMDVLIHSSYDKHSRIELFESFYTLEKTLDVYSLEIDGQELKSILLKSKLNTDLIINENKQIKKTKI